MAKVQTSRQCTQQDVFPFCSAHSARHFVLPLNSIIRKPRRRRQFWTYRGRAGTRRFLANKSNSRRLPCAGLCLGRSHPSGGFTHATGKRRLRASTSFRLQVGGFQRSPTKGVDNSYDRHTSDTQGLNPLQEQRFSAFFDNGFSSSSFVASTIPCDFIVCSCLHSSR